ncbi:MAG: glycosyltransferase family 4 protein [Dehalococcoidales bacterium]
MLLSFTGFHTDMNYISRLGNSLSELSNDVTVVLPNYAKLKDISELNKIIFSYPKGLFPALSEAMNPYLYQTLFHQINALAPDVVHVTFELRVPFFFIRMLHSRFPIVTTIHEPKGISHTLLKTALLNPMQELNVKLLARSSDSIILHGESHKSYLLTKKVPFDKLFVIPHGPFTLPNLTTKPRTDYRFNVLFFGNINPYKGIEYLIKAGKQLSINLPDIVITIAGSGNFSRYSKLINNDKHFIVYNRFIPEQEAADLFQNASLVVLPYIDGSQSGNISLAGSFRKPVIATNVGNFAEMVINGKTGILIPPRDYSALANAMYTLLTNDLMRQEMGENGFNLFQKFTWGDVANKTMIVYQDAIHKWPSK